ncbi:4-galactosyl-N-acetylglucosaminide 3-alpha-L-fucosyltransferase 9-like [Esox lucius]|uniref:4-galactosyl-N-acetylglucosaminide 3-alpha-L-fucosyltransferase 9-like n=1 Tax=Esox lucius TaxID=8010 RepID=UPI0014770D74|nr:4-galactosyl-N-acetylglucosaminide 3-alpha-L-fucosyltransferase 9-like [Esox lucius]
MRSACLVSWSALKAESNVIEGLSGEGKAYAATLPFLFSLFKDMASASSHDLLRPLVLGSFIVMCVLGTFWMYYTPTANRSYPCPGVLREGNQTQRAPNQTPKTHDQHDRFQTEDGVKEAETIVLIWMWPFGVPFDLNSCASFNIKGCLLTANRSLYNKANVVMFHHRDIASDLSDMPKEPRPWFQKWVWYNMESPTYTQRIPGLDHLFNVTASYRLSSDVYVPYGSLVEVSSDDKSFELPKKDKLVCWVVSHWNPNHKRIPIFNELNKHVKIDAFGRHFEKYIEDKAQIVSSCKFYLAFENSIHQDYITKKLYETLHSGSVPVVLGPPRQNYEAVVPKDSFIHVDDFPSLKELADWHIFPDKNETQYMKYFSWLKHYCQGFGHILGH